MSLPLVSLRGVGVTLGSNRVLHDIDLDLPPGECLGITGANGAGKSTLLSVLASLVKPTSGTAEILGVQPDSREIRSVRRRIGLAGHEPGLYPELTLHENLELIDRLRGDSIRMSAREALRVVGLEAAADRKLLATSNGMQRRTDLARLIMTRPDLILLDEAHAGLDEAARNIIDRLVHRTCEADGAAVIVSHDRTLLTTVTRRIVTLDGGGLV